MLTAAWPSTSTHTHNSRSNGRVSDHCTSPRLLSICTIHNPCHQRPTPPPSTHPTRTSNSEVHIPHNLGVGVHLALVGPGVSGLSVLDLQRPVVRLVAVQDLGERERERRGVRGSSGGGTTGEGDAIKRVVGEGYQRQGRKVGEKLREECYERDSGRLEDMIKR